MRNGNRHTYSQFGKMACKICYISSASFIVSSYVSFLFFLCSFFVALLFLSHLDEPKGASEKINQAMTELKIISTSIYLLITFCFASHSHLNGKVRRERMKNGRKMEQVSPECNGANIWRNSFVEQEEQICKFLHLKVIALKAMNCTNVCTAMACLLAAFGGVEL